MNQFIPNSSTSNIDADSTVDSIGDILGIIINVLMGITFAAGIIGLAVGLVQLSTSRGDIKASGKAQDTIKWSVGAVLISFFVIVIKNILVNLLGVDVNTTPDF